MILLILITLFFFGCSENDTSVTPPGEDSSAFYLGFTPFPYDITQSAVLYVYDKIRSDANIISHHFDDGIPWPEALSGTDYHQNIIADWQFRLGNTPATHKILVSVTPINIDRNGLAPYKAEQGNLPLPAPWDTVSFNNPYVKTAYLNYCNKVIDFFNPDYFCFGIEVNLLMVNSPGKWNAYMKLQKYIFTQLSTSHPNLIIFVSFAGMDLIPGYTSSNDADQSLAFQQAISYSDYYGISLYPFLSTFTTDTIPSDMFTKLFSLSNKTTVFTETGYPAQSFSIFGGTIQFNGTQEKQDNYFKQLFNAAEKRGVKFIIDFVLRDYDDLWREAGSPDDISKVWRDTGLYDENGIPRLAHETWMKQLNP